MNTVLIFFVFDLCACFHLCDFGSFDDVEQ